MFGITEHKLETTAQVATYSGGTTAVFAGLSLNEIGVIIGIFVGLVGLAAQLYFGVTRHLREKELHKRQMSDK